MKKNVLVLMSSLMMAACGGGGDSTPSPGPVPTPTPAPTPSPTPAPTPTPAAEQISLFSGKAHYQATCATCHGPDPTANINRIRSAGANNPAAITNAINGVAAMQNLKGKYSAADLSAIASYLAEPTAPPGGLFVGYYQEDPTTNPEDPVPGALYLGLPEGDAAFSGNMYFTYIGCQSSNVGSISGNKAAAAISGNWSGTVDGSAQSGGFSGNYDAANDFYSGTYTVAGGKQPIGIVNCINYIIAPNGTWNLFAVEKNVPSTFTLTHNGVILNWTSPAGYAAGLVTILDVPNAITKGAGNAVKSQSVVTAPTVASDLTPLALTSGRQYLATVSLYDANRQRVAAGSKRFTAP